MFHRRQASCERQPFQRLARLHADAAVEVTNAPPEALVGRQLWPPPEGKWAGGVIGGAAGLLAGSLIGLAWPAPDAEEGTPAAASPLSVPQGFRLTF